MLSGGSGKVWMVLLRSVLQDHARFALGEEKAGGGEVSSETGAEPGESTQQATENPGGAESLPEAARAVGQDELQR